MSVKLAPLGGVFGFLSSVTSCKYDDTSFRDFWIAVGDFKESTRMSTWILVAGLFGPVNYGKLHELTFVRDNTFPCLYCYMIRTSRMVYIH